MPKNRKNASLTERARALSDSFYNLGGTPGDRAALDATVDVLAGRPHPRDVREARRFPADRWAQEILAEEDSESPR